MNAISKQTRSVPILLERIESELQTADGRNVRICRDAQGDFWVVDAAARIIALGDFAADCARVARRSRARARAQAMREIVGSVKRAFARAVRAFRTDSKPAHA
ncbi:MAG: hypothetical protein U1F45_11425 [Burkholderiales bacterium]